MMAIMARPYGSRNAQEREREYVAPMVHKNRRGLVRLSPMVPAEVHAKAFANAKAAGVTMGYYITQLIERDQLNNEGVPVWRAEELEQEAEQEEDERLPLTG
jgi:hypothetical protein